MSTTSEAVLRQVNRLVVVVREEIAAHERLDGLLAQQEAAVTNPSSDAFREATLAIESELARAPHRATKRSTVLKALAGEFGVAAHALTLTSICERLGLESGTLAAERDRLEEVASRTQRRTKKVAALVRAHREVTRELLQAILGSDDGAGADVLGGGTLIDAEV